MSHQNLTFEDWASVLGSERLTGALLDRLTHHVHILAMNGDSYRLKQSAGRRRLAMTATAEQNQATAEAADQRLAGRSGSCLTYKPPSNGRSLATALSKARFTSGLRRPPTGLLLHRHVGPKIPPPLTITRGQTSS